MKQFDDHFADKVREVFDHHEEPFDPKAWHAMNDMLVKKRRAAIIPIFRIAAGVAASLLIISVLTLVLYQAFFIRPTEVAERGLQSDAFSPVSEPGQIEVAVSAITPDLSGKSTSSNNIILKDTQVNPAFDFDSRVSGDITSMSYRTQKVLPDNTDKDLAGINILLTDTTISLADIPVDPEMEETTTDKKETAGQQTIQPDLATHEQEFDLVITSNKDKTEKMIIWGVAAGSMLTYSGQQLSSGLSFTGGVTTEYRLSEQLRIYSGLLLAYQQFELEAIPVSFHEVASGKFDSTRELASVRTYADQDHEMLSVEIPLNVQFHIPTFRKNQWYLSTGLSSLLYIQQEMSAIETSFIETNYLDAESNSLLSSSYASETIIESSATPLSRFDLARLLNISVGYAIHQEKATVIVEPFVKVPLGAISSQEIKMGMAGINLRLTFGK